MACLAAEDGCCTPSAPASTLACCTAEWCAAASLPWAAPGFGAAQHAVLIGIDGITPRTLNDAIRTWADDPIDHIAKFLISRKKAAPEPDGKLLQVGAGQRLGPLA